MKSRRFKGKEEVEPQTADSQEISSSVKRVHAAGDTCAEPLGAFTDDPCRGKKV